MKIAVASSGLGHVTRGIEAWAADLGAALERRGEQVILFKGGGRATVGYEDVIPCLRRDTPLARGLIRRSSRTGLWRVGLGSAYNLEQITFAAGLLNRLRRGRFDILHVQDPVLAVIAHRVMRMGLSRTVPVLGHGTNESAAFLRRLPYVQHLSPWHMDELRRAGAERPTWRAIPNFVDTEQFRPGRAERLRAELGIPSDALVVLCSAAVKRNHKRIDYLLSEFGALRRSAPDIPAWLVVAGSKENDTDELVRSGQSQLGDRVRFLIQHPRSSMAELYRAADVFVLCSLREMMPMALLEAAATGLPCLVHRHPVLEWMAGSGIPAVDMSSPGGLAVALRDLLGNRDLCARAGADSRAHAVAMFGRDRVVDRILGYYAFCLADRRDGHCRRRAVLANEQPEGPNSAAALAPLRSCNLFEPQSIRFARDSSVCR